MKFIIMFFLSASFLTFTSSSSSADGLSSGELDVFYAVGGNTRRIEELTDVKFNSAKCPAGYAVIGGGYRIRDVGTGDENKIFVRWSWPDKNLGVWSTHVRNGAEPVAGAAPLVELEVTAICAK